MEAEISAALERFESIWSRVQAANAGGSPGLSTPCPSGPEARLRSFMDEEASCTRTYQQLSRQFSGQACRCLRALARASAAQLRQLELEYFLRTGDTYVPAASVPLRHSRLEGLRQAYLAACRASATYLAAAGEAGAPTQLYGDLAAGKRRQEKALHGLLAQLLGPA